MELEFDPDKRAQTLSMRGLDFARAGEVFANITINVPDQRQDYGESRMITLGILDERAVVLVWTPRGSKRRIISMRKANDREIKQYY